jgi:ubiquinone/menaquinone biosynthesis C-methylase UbiE
VAVEYSEVVAAWLHAFLLHHSSPRYNRLAGDVKRELFRPLAGNVLEIGAGAGANFEYFPPGIRWTGADPNRHGRRYALRQAERHGIEARWETVPAERLPFPDGSFDAVAATLTLCSVREPGAALAEIRRVLRPGAPFLFLEHVAAPKGSALRRRQQCLRPLFRFFCGCTPDRDTAALVHGAGFSSLTLRPVNLAIPIVSPHVAGKAIK